MQHHQDWEPVVFRKRPIDNKNKGQVAQAQRTGNTETVKKEGSREQRDYARKLDQYGVDDDGTIQKSVLKKLGLEMRKMLMESRVKQNMTREQLAQRINSKVKDIEDLELGKPATDPKILEKLRRVLGITLRFD